MALIRRGVVTTPLPRRTVSRRALSDTGGNQPSATTCAPTGSRGMAGTAITPVIVGPFVRG
jgi:hypothetical protein